MQRKHLVYALASFVALLGVLLWRLLGIDTAIEQPAAPPAEVAAQPPPEAPAPDETATSAEPALLPDEPANYVEAEPTFATIDLEAVRQALPDNSYWDNAAPTADPRLLGDRERAAAHWNDQYGKLLSGTGTEQEIQEYFDHRMRLSSDYVRFADYILETQGSKLSDPDLELLHVAKRLHLARLEEVPRRMQEALDRKVEQDAAREAWLAEQREFEGDDGETPAPHEVP